MGKFYCSVENKWCKLLKHGVCKVANAELDMVNKCPRIAEIETTTLHTLIREVDFEKVFSRLCFYFEDQIKNKDGYEYVFNTLLKKKLKKHRLDDLFINVELVKENESEWLDIHGVNIKNNYKYSIEFFPWRDWVSMFITNKTLNSLSKEDIVAGCLFEMTFHGFEEKKVLEAREKIFKNIEELKMV